MRPLLRWVPGGAIALALTAALTSLSQLPFTPDPGGYAILRLSWRGRGERMETCREPSEQEQANLPAHMRQHRICEGTTAEYRLRVRVDDRSLLDSRVPGSGSRQARPLYVFHELPLAPGRRRVYVLFQRVGASTPAREEEDEREAEEERSRAVPPRLELDTLVTLGHRQVALLTYDPERRALLLVSAD